MHLVSINDLKGDKAIFAYYEIPDLAITQLGDSCIQLFQKTLSEETEQKFKPRPKGNMGFLA